VTSTRHRFAALLACAFAALLACPLVTACGARTAATDSASTAAPDTTQSPEHVINMFGNGKTPPALLRHLTTAQAAHLPALHFSYGPTYQHGRIIGVAVSYPPSCERVKGATVTETATTVTVTVLGTPAPQNCLLPEKGEVWAIKLPRPLGHRAELRRP
jgi:hypothetical protein